MLKYLIEVAHNDNKADCEKAIKLFYNTGSHFLTNADWGCLDGEHKAWFIIEMENKDQALQVLPPILRQNAKIVQLNKFEVDEMDAISAHHA